MILLFTTGQKTFALIFFITFVIGIAWAYRKDKKINAYFYKGSYKVLLFTLFVFFAMYGVVKLKHFLYP